MVKKLKFVMPILIFTLIAAGCSNSDGNNDSETESAIELSTVMFNYSVTKFDEGDDVNNNAWTRHLKEKYGIKVNTLWETAGNQYQDRVNLMITSGEIPDFFAVTPLQFAQLYEADLIEDLTDVYNNHAPDGVKEIFEEAGEEVLQSATLDGKLMAIPWSGVAKEGVGAIAWVRQDWFESLQLAEPETMDDLLAISEAFTTQDPDGNGQDDTFGMALDKDLGMVTRLANGFHAYRGIWIENESGDLEYSTIQPEMKTALATIQDMHARGQIDREFGVKSNEKVYEDIGANKIGMLLGGISSSTYPLRTLTPEVEWIPFPIPSVDSEPTKFQHNLNIFSYYWVVKKGVEHPEAILTMAQEWIDLFYSNTDDEIYKTYNHDEEKNIAHWQNAPVKIYKPFKNVEIHRHLRPLLESDDPESEDTSNLTPEERAWFSRILDYRKTGNMEHWGYVRHAGLEGSGAVIDQIIENDQFKPNKFITIPTKTMTQKMSNLEKMEDEMITNIIKGAPLDEFDTFVENWKRLGGDQITAEVNEWYHNP